MANQTPIVNLGTEYLYGMGLTWLTNTTISVAAGGTRDSTNVIDMQNSSAMTIDITVAGYNGLDTGTVAASTMYAVYSIADSSQNNPNGFILSTSFTQPTLPKDYDSWNRIGAILTDGSSHILKFWQYGREMYYDVGISALSGGSSTSYAEVNVSAMVPPINCDVLLVSTYTPNSATNVAHFLPYGSSATNGIVRVGGGVAAAQVSNIRVPSALKTGAATFQYKVSASDALTLLVAGYIDNVI